MACRGLQSKGPGRSGGQRAAGTPTAQGADRINMGRGPHWQVYGTCSIPLAACVPHRVRHELCTTCGLCSAPHVAPQAAHASGAATRVLNMKPISGGQIFQIPENSRGKILSIQTGMRKTAPRRFFHTLHMVQMHSHGNQNWKRAHTHTHARTHRLVCRESLTRMRKHPL